MVCALFRAPAIRSAEEDNWQQIKMLATHEQHTNTTTTTTIKQSLAAGIRLLLVGPEENDIPRNHACRACHAWARNLDNHRPSTIWITQK